MAPNRPERPQRSVRLRLFNPNVAADDRSDVAGVGRLIGSELVVAAAAESLAEHGLARPDRRVEERVAREVVEEVRVVAITYGSLTEIVSVSPALVERVLQDLANASAIAMGLAGLISLSWAALRRLRRGSLSDERLETLTTELTDEWEIRFPWGQNDIVLRHGQVERRTHRPESQ